MKTIVFANQKGGVGKTASTLCTALILAEKYKVLVIDGDSQCNLTYSNFRNNEMENSLEDVFSREKSIRDCICKSDLGDFDFIKNSVSLANADKKFTNIMDGLILKNALKDVQNDYDYCLIDCPPFVGVLTFNYFNSADYVVIPVNASCYSVQGLSTLFSVISDIKASVNHKIRIAGILLTMFNRNTNVSRQIEDFLTDKAKKLKTRLFNTTIRKSVVVERIISEKKNILKMNSARRIYEDYKNFAEELLEVIK